MPLAYSALSEATSNEFPCSQRMPVPLTRWPTTLQPASVGPLPTSQPRARYAG